MHEVQKRRTHLTAHYPLAHHAQTYEVRFYYKEGSALITQARWIQLPDRALNLWVLMSSLIKKAGKPANCQLCRGTDLVRKRGKLVSNEKPLRLGHGRHAAIAYRGAPRSASLIPPSIPGIAVRDAARARFTLCKTPGGADPVGGAGADCRHDLRTGKVALQSHSRRRRRRG